MKYSDDIKNDMVGKTVESVSVNGFFVEITFTDGSEFCYEASDAGYSSYQLKLKDSDEK